MSKFANAVRLHFKEWEVKIDKEFAEAEAQGKIPDESPEEIRIKAKAIWKKAHEQNGAS